MGEPRASFVPYHEMVVLKVVPVVFCATVSRRKTEAKKTGRKSGNMFWHARGLVSEATYD